MSDILIVDTVAYCTGWEMAFVNVADPQNLRLLPGRWVPPSFGARRLLYEPPYIYVAASDGGVCILETLQTGLSEGGGIAPVPAFRVWPSITTGQIRMEVENEAMKPVRIKVFSVTGELVFSDENVISSAPRIDLTRLPAGVYLVRAMTAAGSRFSSKVVKQ